MKDISGKRITLGARILSLFLHPLLVPVYGSAILLWSNTVLRNIPQQLKIYYIAMVAITLCCIPALAGGLIRNMSLVRSHAVGEKQKRLISMTVTLVCYIACVLMITNSAAVFLVRSFIVAGIGCVLLAIVLELIWKSSPHLIAAGALTAMLSLVNFSGFGLLNIAMSMTLVLAGLLGSARLWLGSNNAGQIAASFWGGFLMVATVMLI